MSPINPQETPMLKMKKFQVEVIVVPSILEVQLTGAEIERKTVEIEGYSLQDAKRRAGIK